MRGTAAFWIALTVVGCLIGVVAGCGGGGDDDRPQYGELGTTALCNDNTFSFETDCTRICAESGVKQWYVNCGQEGTGPTNPLP